jgi:hypothetical protein
MSKRWRSLSILLFSLLDESIFYATHTSVNGLMNHMAENGCHTGCKGTPLLLSALLLTYMITVNES